MLTAKVKGMAASEKLDRKGRNRDEFGLQFGECPTQPHQVGGVREDDEIGARLNSAAP